jgi:hypothetical protein
MVNTGIDINTPLDYTVQEPLTQGKKLQKHGAPEKQKRAGGFLAIEKL